MRDIPKIHSDKIIATWSGGEDAALWHIDDERIGILTVDFITPVVDDPRVWGQIAAANSLSDVFAMGGSPTLALNIVGFPTKKLELSILKQILEGGFEKVSEAGAFLVGGHSVEDSEPKYGLVVFGEVHKNKKWLTSGARDGDALLLTKPLGTGIITTAIKADMIEDQASVEEAIASMTKLNDLPRKIPENIWPHIHACTDVTGFGLAGHALDMLSGGGLDLEIFEKNLPVITGAQSLADSGLMPEGAYRNRQAYKNHVDSGNDILFDAQTSGGLMLAIAPEIANEMLKICRDSGFDKAAIIGKFKNAPLGGGNALRKKLLFNVL